MVLTYDPSNPDTNPNRYNIKRRDIAPYIGSPQPLNIAYVDENPEGHPTILLLHGFPKTMREWWKVIGPLAESGFRVIAPDYRGMGQSDIPPPVYDDGTGYMDIAALSKDIYALVHDALGIQTVVIAGGDSGGMVAPEIAVRHPEFVDSLILFNTMPSVGGEVEEAYKAIGFQPARWPLGNTYYQYVQGQRQDLIDALVQSPNADEMVQDLWVALAYTQFLWANPNGFKLEDLKFHTEPFTAESFRQMCVAYRGFSDLSVMSEFPQYFTKKVETPTLLLHGEWDSLFDRTYVDGMCVAYPNHQGPYISSKAGHFLPWEDPEFFIEKATEFLGKG